MGSTKIADLTKLADVTRLVVTKLVNATNLVDATSLGDAIRLEDMMVKLAVNGVTMTRMMANAGMLKRKAEWAKKAEKMKAQRLMGKHAQETADRK